MDKPALEDQTTEKRAILSDDPALRKKHSQAEDSAAGSVKTAAGSTACRMSGRSWFKGAMGMAICCAAPALVFAAIAFFGLSLGAIASGAVSLIGVLACPIGMFLMMRAMMKHGK